MDLKEITWDFDDRVCLNQANKSSKFLWKL